MRIDNETHFYQFDHQGSIIATSNNLGKVEAKYSYSTFGEPIGTSSQFGYTGREYDEPGGPEMEKRSFEILRSSRAVQLRSHGLLHILRVAICYYRARYYDPITGRFLSKDPIGYSAGDSNFYRYVMNSPYNFTDPSGLKPGDKFPSADEAAGDAINYINPISIQNNVEYGGYIYPTPSGEYIATVPISGGPYFTIYSPTLNCMSFRYEKTDLRAESCSIRSLVSKSRFFWS